MDWARVELRVRFDGRVDTLLGSRLGGAFANRTDVVILVQR
jgi:hypothetical protein